MKRILLTLLIGTSLATPAMAAKIGVSMALFDDNFLTVLRNGMSDYAKAQPGVSLQLEDAKNDVSKQLSQIQNFIANKVDAIIVNPVDTSATAAMTKLAAEAGVPLVYVNREPVDVDKLGPKAAFVASNEKDSGTLETQQICKLLGGKGDILVIEGELSNQAAVQRTADIDNLGPKAAFVASNEVESGTLEMQQICKLIGGKGNILVMEGQLSNQAAVQRTADVHDVIAKAPCDGIKIVAEQTAEWDRTKAQNLMTNWLSKGLKFDAVVANNDEMAVGAIQALKSAGVDTKTAIVGGVDATQDALASMKAGDLKVTVFQDAAGQGKGAVDAALALAAGKTIDKKVYIPFQLVTPENMDKFAKKN